MLRNQPDVIKRRPHYRLQKTTLGVASVLLSTSLYFGISAHADTVTQPAGAADQTNLQTSGQATPFSAAASASDTNSAAGSADSGAVDAPAAAGEMKSDAAPAAPVADAKSEANSGSAGKSAVNLAADPTSDNHASAAAPVTAPGSTAQPASDPAALTKQITRTINVVTPTGATSQATQTVTYTRAKADSPWTTDNDTFAVYNLPRVDGYVAYDADGGNAVQAGRVLAVKTTANMQNLVVNVKYRREQGSVTINVVDEKGAIITNKVVTGSDDSTQAVELQIPDGYVLDNGQSVPTQVTIHGNSAQNVRVHALVVTVNPDDPQPAGTKIPGTQKLTFPSGVAEHDLNWTVTRQIHLTKADGTTQTITQPSVTFHRSATVNAATGKVTYSAWDQASAVIPAYELEVPAGQAPVVTGSLGVWEVKPGVVSTVVDVRLVESDAAVTVEFVDANDPEAGEINEASVDGVVGQTVAVDLQIPVGWQLAPGQTLPTTVHLTSADQDPLVVKLVAQHVTVTPTDPKTPDDVVPGTDDTYNYPAGVTKDDLNKEVTRDIYEKLPGQAAKKVTTQSVTVSRTADVDVVYGDVTYGAWSKANFEAYAAPTEENYTPDQTQAPVAAVEFDHDGNPVNQSFTFNYVDATQDVTDTKDVTRTIFTQLEGQAQQKVDIQTLTLHRNGVKDLATGKTTWDSWQSDSFAAVTAPAIAGYTVINPKAGAAVTADGAQDNYSVVFQYVANEQSTNVVYKDGNTVVATVPLNGKTAQSVAVHFNIPTNYTQKSVEPNANYNPTTGQYTFTADHNGDLVVQLNHATEPASDTKTLTRTIKVTNPVTGQTQTTTQKVTLTRTGTTDKVTGQTTWGAWTTGSWDKFEVPTVPGYTASTGSVPAQTVTSETVPATVEVTYTADKQTTNVVYVDQATGQTVKTQPLTGTTDATVKVDYQVPANYHIVAGKVATYHFQAGNNPVITVQLGHDTQTVNDAKEVTRTIKVTAPDGSVATQHQFAHLTRTGSKDLVTGQTTWQAWSTATWAKYDVPTVAGYTPTMREVPAVTVDGNTADSTVEISYTANAESVNVVYKDGNQVVKVQPVTGKTGETVKLAYQVPANYHVTNKPAATHTFTADANPDIVVELGHNLTTVHDTKTIVRTINVTNPDGQVKTTKQTANLSRDGQKDEVTGLTAWQSWSTGAWDQFDTPVLAGYTPSMTKVAGASVTSETKPVTVEITYTANAQTVTVVYQTPDGTPVKTVTVTGKTGQTVKIPSDVPAGYEMQGKVPSEVTVQPNGTPDVIVTVVPKLSPVTDNKTVTRTINVTNPDGSVKTTKQVAHLTRTGNKNEVTGAITWGAWSTDNWDQFDTPVLAGYTPSVTKVAGAQVTSETKPVTVDIIYTTNAQTVTVVYQTPDGTPVKTATVTGKTGQTVPVPNNVPANYHTTGQVPSEVTFSPNGTPNVVITVEPNMTDVTDAKTVTRTINVASPDGNVKSTTQVAHLTRTGVKNEVTGETAWGDWSTDNWDQFAVPTIVGYTPTQTVVDAQAVDGNTADTTVNISYTANDQEVTVIYRTPDGDVAKRVQIPGKTGETVKIPNDVPAGYHVIGKVPGEFTITGDNSEVAIMVEKDQVPTKQDQNVVSRMDHEIGGTPAYGQNPAFDRGEVSQPRQTSQTPAAKQGQLPQTGDNETGAMALGLSGMLAGLAGLFGMKKKEN